MQGIDWDAFFGRYSELALRSVARFGEAAEDLVQEAVQATLERAHRGPPFESQAHARHYFFRTLHNRAAESGRRAGRHGPQVEETEFAAAGDDPAQAAALSEELALDQARLARLGELIEGLRAEERVALQLRYQEGLTLAAMAERTGVPLSTLGERVQAGLQKIRRRLGRTDPRSK